MGGRPFPSKSGKLFHPKFRGIAKAELGDRLFRQAESGPKLGHGYRDQARTTRKRAILGILQQRQLLNVTHADPKEQRCVPNNSGISDGTALEASEARKQQHDARPGHVSIRRAQHTISTLAV